MSIKSPGDCIGYNSFSFVAADGVKTIPSNTGASRALVQFVTSAAGIAAIGSDVASYTGIVKWTEDGSDPAADFSNVGMMAFHGAMIEIIGQANIQAFKCRAFAAGYTVYAKVFYYK